MAQTQEPPVKDPDLDGLPVFKDGKQVSDSTDDGLPILKKKDESSVSVSGGPKSYPLGSTPIPTDASTSESKSDLHPQMFGKPAAPKPKKETNVNASGLVDQIDEATKKPELNARKTDLTNKFFDADLSGEDVDLIRAGAPAGQFQQGLSSNEIAGAINNKTRNLKVWANTAVMTDLKSAVGKLNDINEQLTHFAGSEEMVQKLKDQRDFLKHSISQVYNEEMKQSIPKVISSLKTGVFGGKEWDQIIEDSKPHEKENPFGNTVIDPLGNAHHQPKYFVKYDDKTHTLTPESTQSILQFTDDWANKNKNDVLKAGQFGKFPEGENNYSDLGKQVVNYLNTVPPVDYNNKKATEEFKAKNKKLAPLIDHQEQMRNYFSTANNAAQDAYVNTYQDKNFVITKEKYAGKNGILTSNPEFIKIQHKWAEAVGRKEIDEDLAKKQMQGEIENNPALKKISDQYDAEVESIRKKGREMRADYITKGLQSSVDPNLVVYPSGNVGVKGMGENEVKFKKDQYNDLLTKTTAETLHKQNEGLKLSADERAEKQGAFFGSLKQSSDEMAGAFYKWFFDKTGWGGDNMRMFQSNAIAEVPVTESDVAKAWNWQGAKSLIKPQFYASKVGAMMPVIAPAALASVVTEGAALPESVQWLAGAGVFTFQDAVSFNNQLLNSTDKYGNKLTDFDAANAAATQAKEEFLPNLVFMALSSGTLARAKTLTKPTLGKVAKDAVIGSAAGVPAMAVQGYLSHANELEAKGQQAGIWDYMQDPHFATSLIDGFIGGLGLQLAHAPSKYARELQTHKNMVARSEGEFRDNAMYNVALQHEISGSGNYLRDGLKVLSIHDNISDEVKAELTHQLQYSTALDRNIKGGKGIDISNINGAYQAHNLALADMHDQWAEQNKDNKNLSKIYSDQAKEFRDQAKNAMDGKGKFHYLIDANDNPVFISDQSFKHLDSSGRLAEMIKEGTVKDIHSSDDPGFSREYKQALKDRAPEAPEPYKPTLEPEDHENIIQALKDHRNQFSDAGERWIGTHLDNPKAKPEEISEAIISQAMDHGNQQKVAEMVGPEAFKVIKPVIEEQKALRKEKANLPELREKSEAAGILDQQIDSSTGRKPVTLDGESVRGDVAVKQLKEKHSILSDLIKNCL